MPDNDSYLSTARAVIEEETGSMKKLLALIGEDFGKVCEAIEDCPGRIVFMGVGQSFHVARKSACSMASLGKPAFYVHATEAVHGDMGLVTGDDIVILISHSGETKEVLATLGPLNTIGASTIAIVSKLDSTLGKACDFVLATGVEQEAGPIKFAPSSSALVTTALCDAIVMAIADSIGFTEEDYSKYHPGGAIGEKLLGKE